MKFFINNKNSFTFTNQNKPIHFKKFKHILNATSTLHKPQSEEQIRNGVYQGYWNWNGHNIRYQRSGDKGEPIVLVHGFGANCDHWRKNIDILGKNKKTYSIDLLGYGYSDKPNPMISDNRDLYTFETWSLQVSDFIKEKIQEPSFIICNSIGGFVGLETSIQCPEIIKGVQLHNISLRKLHVKNQSYISRPFIKAFQNLLFHTKFGEYFFKNVAKKETVRKILEIAYSDSRTVTDQLVEDILNPGLLNGSSRVFLAFICYSSGPLPHELLKKTKKPVSILWGADDPWEKIEWGRDFQSYPSVVQFIEIPGVGHCPHDEAPDVVNPLIENFVNLYSSKI